MMMRLTRRQEQGEAESVGNAKEKERRRESVKQTNTAAGISSNPGDHPHIFFFLDFFSRRWPSETFRCQLHILNSFSKPSVKEIS
jgi:hypothetical protein